MDKRITALVIDSDVNYSRELTAYIKSRDEFLDAEYATNGNTGYQMMRAIKPDVIIMDFLVAGLDAIGFLRMLKGETQVPRPAVIINSVAMLSSMVNTATEYGADYIMAKPQPCSEVCNTVIDLMEGGAVHSTPDVCTDESTEVRISRFLHYMGVPAHLNGYKYIRSALKQGVDDLGSIIPITRKLYPALAKEYNKSPECIERAIRHAIKVSWERGNKKIIHDIFGYSADTSYYGCPTNSEYIAMIADDLRMRMKYDMDI